MLYIVHLQLKDPLVILVGNFLPHLGFYPHCDMALAVGVEGLRIRIPFYLPSASRMAYANRHNAAGSSGILWPSGLPVWRGQEVLQHSGTRRC